MKEITVSDVHNALVARPDCEKIAFALNCQVYGVKPEVIEATIANMVNGVARSVEPILDYYSRGI
ncbi:MAG: hypothetical protein Q4F83_11130 [Eubacteriales bacterium]|nr:hypothetical protein [Eubacteriales bacterium]